MCVYITINLGRVMTHILAHSSNMGSSICACVRLCSYFDYYFFVWLYFDGVMYFSTFSVYIWQAYDTQLMLGLCLLPPNPSYLNYTTSVACVCAWMLRIRSPWTVLPLGWNHKTDTGWVHLAVTGHTSTAGVRPGWSRSSSTAGSTENLSGMSSRLPQSGMRRSAIPTPASHRPQDSSDSPAPSHTPTNFRSNSAIDLQAARRAQARSQYAQAQRLKVGSGASLRK